MDWKRTGIMPCSVISTMSEESIGPSMLEQIGTGSGPSLGSTWPANNEARFFPIKLRAKTVFSQFFWLPGSGGASGTVDLGVYTPGGGRIASTGSQSCVGTSALQIFSVTAFVLTPGWYYIAMALSGTQTYGSYGSSVQQLRAIGAFQQATALPLPSPATFAAITDGGLPLMGMAMGKLT